MARVGLAVTHRGKPILVVLAQPLGIIIEILQKTDVD